MKKVIAILTVGFLLFASCSKEDDNTPDVSINKSANKKATGTSSNDLLSDKKFKSMVIELVYVDGIEPSAAAINNFVSFIEARTYKPEGITVLKKSIPSPGKVTFTVQEITEIEDANRT